MKIWFTLLTISILVISCAGKQESESTHALTVITPVAPENSDQEAFLKQLPDAPTGKQIKSGSHTAVVTNSYFAASGRECKSVEISLSENDTPIYKTVCDFDGTWGYAPDVLPTTLNQ